MPDTCIFAHYSERNAVAEYVFHYLGQILAAGFDIYFVSASSLSDCDKRRLTAYCFDVAERENVGHDFASWSYGLSRWQDRITGRLLLTNDSVYGPTSDLKESLTRLTKAGVDWYAMVQSSEVQLHAQSWFLLFEPIVVKSATFKRIFSQDFAAMTRQEIIRNAEVPLLAELTKVGFTHHAAYRARRDLLLPRTFRLNPMHTLAADLVERDVVPFVKVELLRDNPLRLPLDDVRRALALRSPRLPALIEAHAPTPRSRSSNPGWFGRVVTRHRAWVIRRHARSVWERSPLLFLTTAACAAWAWVLPYSVITRAIGMVRRQARPIGRALERQP